VCDGPWIGAHGKLNWIDKVRTGELICCEYLFKLWSLEVWNLCVTDELDLASCSLITMWLLWMVMKKPVCQIGGQPVLTNDFNKLSFSHI